MIKFECTEVTGFEAALRGMRNPLNSWHRADSFTVCDWTSDEPHDYRCNLVTIGPNDMDLAKRLIKAGSDHRKFLRQIFVTVDITAPIYWWKEFDKYQIAVTTNSCSTMHKIHAKEFTFDDFSYEHLDGDAVYILGSVIDVLNNARESFVQSKAKHDWWQMIQLLPSSYNQKRTVSMNYEVLRNISNSRRGHKLDEWSIDFMDWIYTLPYAKELIIN